MNETGVAVVDGRCEALEDARVPVSDRGFLFGHAIFETLLIREGRIIGWNDHMARLARGCERAFLRMPDARELRAWVKLGCEENARRAGRMAEKVSVRLMVTGGSGTSPAGAAHAGATLAVPRDAAGNLQPARVVIVCKDAPSMSPAARHKGLALHAFPEARSMPLVDVKSTSYLWNMLALEAARAKGCDDAIFYTPDGALSECTTANFVWVTSDRLVCAMPNKDRCLPGTTLQALSRALRKHEHMINDMPLMRTEAELSQALACFVLSSVRGLVGVRSIDGHAFDLEANAELAESLNGYLDAELTRNAQDL